VIWTQGFATNPGSVASVQGVAVVQEPTYVQGLVAGAVFVGGEFGMTVGNTISFGTQPIKLTSNGTSDMFLARLAP
jgi:hypothetical protein